MPFTYSRNTNQPTENQGLSRSNSFFVCDGQVYHIEPSSQLHQGQSGVVRFFTNDKQGRQVVKTPHSHNASLKDANKEVEYYQKVYPALYISLDSTNEPDYRLVLPYLGVELGEYADKCSDAELVELFFSVISELERIHRLGITHYDLVLRNILINENNQVFIIDGITHTNTPTAQHLDINNLAITFDKLAQKHGIYSVRPHGVIKTIPELRNYIHTACSGVNELPTYNEEPIFNMPFGLSAPKKEARKITRKLWLAMDQVEEAQKQIHSKSIKKQMKQLLAIIENGVTNGPLQNSQAITICERTKNLLQNPTLENIKQYRQFTNQISGENIVRRTVRPVSKTMGVLSAIAILGLLVVPGINIPTFIILGCAVICFAFLAYMSARNSLYSQMHKLAIGNLPDSTSQTCQSIAFSMS